MPTGYRHRHARRRWHARPRKTIASQRAYEARRSRRQICVADPALASDEASYVTGTNIDIAGGR